jgi:hypothetical protein
VTTPPATQPDQPLDAPILATTAAERVVLEAFLDYLRDAVVRKVRGVSEEDARRRLVGSATTLGGVAKHLRWVEMNWFQRVLDRRPDEELPAVPWTDEDPDADFRLEPTESVEQVLADYQAACGASRETAARYGIDDVVPHRRLGNVSLRWIYAHMVEETGRHAGHVDILRELIDGATGD